MDFLSFCPSLVDIFKLVNHRDILKCNLVNRTFHDVIHTNSNSMPKRELCLEIKTFREETTGTPFVLISNPKNHIYIAPGWTILAKCQKLTFEHYRLNASAGELVSETIEKNNLLNRLQHNEEEFKNMSIYKNDSFLHGLRTIWTYLLRNYDCTEVILESEMPEEWMNVLSECCETVKARTPFHLVVPLISSALQRLVKSLGCPKLYTIDITEGTLMSDLQEIFSWNVAIEVGFFSNFFKSRQYYILLQMWCSGDLSMDKIVLYCGGNVSLWTSEHTKKMLGNLNQDTIEITQDPHNASSSYIMLRRNCDARILYIRASWNNELKLLSDNIVISEQ